MDHFQLPYRNSLIGYYRFGTGPKTAVCFHGYGETGKSFGFLEKYAGNQYTFYSIDLPFHGLTDWKEGYDFHAADLAGIVQMILKKGGQQATGNGQPLTLLGFSLGGRVVLGLYQEIPQQVERIVLLAPDGLKINFWYWLATQTRTGNRFFAFTMKKPEWFFGFLKWLNKLRLVNASIFKFVNYYIGDAEVRRLLYARWTTLRRIRPHISRIKKYIRDNKTTARLLYGKHDRIILSSVGQKFKRGIELNCEVNIIHSGHQVLHEKHAEDIVSALLR